jgi:NitT/TauT family transport system substrate-binding protein
VVIGLVAVGVSSYGSKSTKSTAGTAVSTTDKHLSASTVKIGYYANITQATPLIGIQKGFLQSALGSGTKMSTTVFTAGPAEITALNAGAVDIGWIGPSPAISGYAQSGGKSLKIISGATSGGVEFVVNPKKITGVNDLKGKTIASPQLGNTQDVALLNYLSTRGFKENPVSGKGDVTVARVAPNSMPAAYAAGSIDGAWVPEPTAAQLVAKGAKVLFNENSLWTNGQFVTVNVIVAQSFLKAHPDVVKAVLEGSVATNAWINNNNAAAKTAANAALAKVNGQPLPANQIDSAWSTIAVTNDPLATTLNQQEQHAVNAGLLKKANLNGIYDLTILNAILKSQGKPPVSSAGLGAS